MQRITRCSNWHIRVTCATDCNSKHCVPVIFKLYFSNHVIPVRGMMELESILDLLGLVPQYT